MKCTNQDQLRDACYHLVNMTEDTDKISFAYDIRTRAMSPFAKLILPLLFALVLLLTGLRYDRIRYRIESYRNSA